MSNKVVSIEERIPKLKEQRKKKTNRRIIFFIIIFFLIVVTVVYFQSPLSKVGTITFTGNKLISDELILHTAGLSTEKSIWSIHSDEIVDSLKNISEVKEADLTITFPNKVHIEIEEYEIVGILATDHNFTPILENGVVIQDLQSGYHFFGPILKGFSQSELIELAASELHLLSEEVYHSISEIIYSPKKTNQYRVVIYMNDGYEVHANLRTLSEKLNYYPALIKQLDPDIKGIFDLEVGLFFKSYDSIMELQVESGEESES